MKNNMKKCVSRKKKIVAAILCVSAIVLLGALLFVNSMLNKINRMDADDAERIPREEETIEKDDGSEETIGEDEKSNFIVVDGIEMLQDENIKNILLIGQDRREGQGRERSDSIIICSIDEESDKIILTSIMRDTYVQIPGYSDNRINAAYKFGGAPLLNEVIEKNFGIHIDANVEVDFNGFVQGLNVVGNLEIELNTEEAAHLGLEEGVNSLTPSQCLSYARTRYVGNSDWERTERQKRVLMAAFDKVMYLTPGEILELANELLPCVSTDLSNGEIIDYVSKVVTSHMIITENHRIPVDGTYTTKSISGMSVLVPNCKANNQYLKENIYKVE